MISHTLLEFEELSSTSNFLKENQTYFPNMTFIRTNHQTQGRGQYDREWESQAGENLLFSILLKDINVSKAYDIKKWITTTLMLYFQKKDINVSFKEPNDIYFHDKKLCGILIETQSSSHIFDYVVIGIGINVNQVAFANEKATSIRQILSQKINISHLFNELLTMLTESYQHYIL
ncbi:MAG: biotin--[acetyl-CoA-carboxylase] ligase [Acholeplasmataceae bacterium]|nr:biotin--[acetyl-CoA-carboxylase] ligase [Acholeplasmataceae bacterium]